MHYEDSRTFYDRLDVVFEKQREMISSVFILFFNQNNLKQKTLKEYSLFWSRESMTVKKSHF